MAKRPWLPTSIRIEIKPDKEYPTVAHVKAFIEDEPSDWFDIGVIHPEGSPAGDGPWLAEYGNDCQNDGETGEANGPMEAIGMLLDNALQQEDTFESYDESEEDEADDDEDDDLGDLEDPVVQVRHWTLVAYGTWALEVHGPVPDSTGSTLNGCLVRYEDDGNWPSVIFVRGVTIDDLRTERRG